MTNRPYHELLKEGQRRIAQLYRARQLYTGEYDRLVAQRRVWRERDRAMIRAYHQVPWVSLQDWSTAFDLHMAFFDAPTPAKGARWNACVLKMQEAILAHDRALRLPEDELRELEELSPPTTQLPSIEDRAAWVTAFAMLPAGKLRKPCGRHTLQTAIAAQAA